jgi:hypothetical protein
VILWLSVLSVIRYKTRLTSWGGSASLGGSLRGRLNRFAIGGLGFAGGLFGFVIMIDFIKFDSLWF